MSPRPGSIRGMMSASPIAIPDRSIEDEADATYAAMMSAPAPSTTTVSRQAADAVKKKMPRLRRLTLGALVDAPLNSTEVARKIGHPKLSSIKPRLTELMGAGFVEKAGVRPNPDGFTETLWAITDQGRNYAREER